MIWTRTCSLCFIWSAKKHGHAGIGDSREVFNFLSYIHTRLYLSVNYLLKRYQTILESWDTNILDSLFCCAAGVTMALHATIPHR